jgi:hypothetical protein
VFCEAFKVKIPMVGCGIAVRRFSVNDPSENLAKQSSQTLYVAVFLVYRYRVLLIMSTLVSKHPLFFF